MGIFDKVKKTTIASRRYEEKLYEVALEEVENNEIRKGLYSKAISKADGDKEKADGIYLKLRVQSIMDDIESEQIDRREDARAYKAIQKLKELESINVEIKVDPLYAECKELLGNKGYKLHKSPTGEYHIGTGGGKEDLITTSVYSSKDLNNIRKKAAKILRKK
jgi:hypothetical protein